MCILMVYGTLLLFTGEGKKTFYRISSKVRTRGPEARACLCLWGPLHFLLILLYRYLLQFKWRWKNGCSWDCPQNWWMNETKTLPTVHLWLKDILGYSEPIKCGKYVHADWSVKAPCRSVKHQQKLPCEEASCGGCQEVTDLKCF